MLIRFRQLTKTAASLADIGRLAAAFILVSSFASAQSYSPPRGSESGAFAVWIFANLSFTGMRAQSKGSLIWKVITFVFGFPGTLLTLLVVTRGSERAYGIDMPRKGI